MFNPQPKPEPKPKKKKKPIPKVSKKRKPLNEQYKVIRDIWIKDKVCARCGNPNVECHHVAGRNGKINGIPLLIYVPYFMALCSECHRFITDNSEYAYQNGYSIKRNLMAYNVFGLGEGGDFNHKSLIE